MGRAVPTVHRAAVGVGAVMTPYYDQDGITLHCADSRTCALPTRVAAVITDPPWPGPKAAVSGSDDPYGLLTAVAARFPGITDRVVIHLGGMTDPRFLTCIPPELEFLRVCWLRFTPPRYRGTVLDGADVAYVFGKGWLGKPGAHVLPGEFTSASKGKREWGVTHPCPRNASMVEWLVANYTRPGDLILDPFAGSGTTLMAARNLGRRAVGIEINPGYCAEIAERLSRQSILGLTEVAM